MSTETSIILSKDEVKEVTMRIINKNQVVRKNHYCDISFEKRKEIMIYLHKINCLVMDYHFFEKIHLNGEIAEFEFEKIFEYMNTVTILVIENYNYKVAEQVVDFFKDIVIEIKRIEKNVDKCNFYCTEIGNLIQKMRDFSCFGDIENVNNLLIFLELVRQTQRFWSLNNNNEICYFELCGIKEMLIQYEECFDNIILANSKNQPLINAVLDYVDSEFASEALKKYFNID